MSWMPGRTSISSLYADEITFYLGSMMLLGMCLMDGMYRSNIKEVGPNSKGLRGSFRILMPTFHFFGISATTKPFSLVICPILTLASTHIHTRILAFSISRE